jgi:hypothetical protein
MRRALAIAPLLVLAACGGSIAPDPEPLAKLVTGTVADDASADAQPTDGSHSSDAALAGDSVRDGP